MQEGEFSANRGTNWTFQALNSGELFTHHLTAYYKGRARVSVWVTVHRCPPHPWAGRLAARPACSFTGCLSFVFQKEREREPTGWSTAQTLQQRACASFQQPLVLPFVRCLSRPVQWRHSPILCRNTHRRLHTPFIAAATEGGSSNLRVMTPGCTLSFWASGVENPHCLRLPFYNFIIGTACSSVLGGSFSSTVPWLPSCQTALGTFWRVAVVILSAASL